jgi:D-alanyl-lipoteichoic acid acyltransferase DltB (MBOAT superfamily)
MGFDTLIFWIAFAAVFVAYWTFIAQASGKLRHLVILALSYAFYASFDWRALPVIVLSSLVDFVIANQIPKHPRHSRLLVGTSVCLNLGLLILFKYRGMFGDWAGTEHWITPLGISFYTFQTLGYTLDVHKRRIEPERNLVTYLAFVSFFPQLIAGPVERAKDLMPQFKATPHFDIVAARRHVLRILWGAFKTVVIAHRFAIFTDHAAASPGNIDSLSACLFLTFKGYGLYAQFSGYTDMAIGMAGLLGFRLSENFRNPLAATSFRAFWRRWHITIHTWFRDYLIPLLPRGRRWSGIVIAIVIFVVSGLWHGPTIYFVLWGLVNAAFTFVWDPFLLKLPRRFWVEKASNAFVTFWIFLSLILFGATSQDQILTLLARTFSLEFDFSRLTQFGLASHELVVAVLLVALLWVVDQLREKRRLVQWAALPHGHFYRWGTALSLSLAIVLFGFYNKRPGGAEEGTAGKHRQFQYDEF